MIGSRTPAMSHSSVDQPAVQLTTVPALDRRRGWSHAGDAAVGVVDAGDLGVGMDLGAACVGAAREAPDDGVVADDPARRVVERADDRIGRVRAERSSPGASRWISSGQISRESMPCRRLTSARLAITNIARSECASVRWPHWREQQVEVELRAESRS